jgi:hypothetical protein
LQGWLGHNKKRRVWRHPSLRARGWIAIWRARLVLMGFVLTQLSSALVLLHPGGRVLADTAPTVSSYQTSTWTDVSGTPEVTGTLTWSAGDLIVVMGTTESGSKTLATPTATGLTFSLITSINVADDTDCVAYLWTATAGSGGSSAVSAANTGTTDGARGIAAYAFTGSDGLGTSATLDNSANKVISLARAHNNSAVVTVLGDWNAVNDTSVTTSPAGGTVRHADFVTSSASFFLADWGDQGTATTTGYGITNHTGTVDMSGIAVEVRGAAASSTTEQEGYRWRADDGSETTATWLAAQDTNITRPADTNTRLRALINSTGDPASSQYQLEYKKSTGGSYAKVPTALPVAGAVAYGAVGTYAPSTGATSLNPLLPAGVTALSELWTVVGSKNNATHTSSSTNWTKVTQQNSGASWTVSLWRYTGADATAAGSITVTWTGSVASFGRSLRMQGRTGTDPLGTPSISAGTTATHTSTGVTTTSPGSRVIYVDAAAANTVLDPPASWTENSDNGSATGATHLVIGGRDLGSSGSSSGNISGTGANAAWVQMQIELPAPQPAILVSASSNITASGQATTAQLTAPSGKTTSDFVTGRMQDDENPADAVDITANDYTELEWSLTANGAVVVNADIYQFRVTNNGAVLNTYTVTPQWTIGTGNAAPSSPSSLVQQKTDDTAISTGGWTSETSVELTATVTDSDGGDTVKICAEVDPVGTAFTSPVGDGDGCSASGVSTGGTALVTISGLSTDTEYHWQIKAKDAAGAYSSWVGYGGNTENPPTNPAARDFGVDTSAPASGTVYDGTSAGVDSAFNDGSLSALSANWSGFTATTSGLQKYEYAIGTTQGGTQVRAFTDNTTATTVTATGLTLQTSQLYYFSVKAYDNAGNTTIVNSNGQLVAPSLSFSISPTTLAFDNLNASNSFTNTKTTTLTTSTNAYGGYVVRLAALDYLRSSGNVTIPDFSGGTYASPDSWQSGDLGFGYTSSDTTIQGVNKFQNNPCPGGGGLLAPGCYAPYSQAKPGDIVADHTGNVTGSPIVSEQFTITHSLTVGSSQAATNYAVALLYSVTALY